jgi:hypothetical protein
MPRQRKRSWPRRLPPKPPPLDLVKLASQLLTFASLFREFPLANLLVNSENGAKWEAEAMLADNAEYSRLTPKRRTHDRN